MSCQHDQQNIVFYSQCYQQQQGSSKAAVVVEQYRYNDNGDDDNDNDDDYDDDDNDDDNGDDDGNDDDNDDDDDVRDQLRDECSEVAPPHTGGRFRNNLNSTYQLRSLQHMPLHTLKHTL